MTVDIPEVFLEQARRTVSKHVKRLFKALLRQSHELGGSAGQEERRGRREF